jgi:polyhydroxybutyrate depolymerase
VKLSSFATLNLALVGFSVLAGCSGDGAGTDSGAMAGTGGGAATAGGVGGGTGTGTSTGGTGGAATAGGVGGTSGSASSTAGGAGGTSATGGADGGVTAGGSGGGGTGGDATGGSGGGAGGPNAPVPSAGCDTAADQASETFVEQPMLDVDGAMRRWWVWLPETYDPTRAYPVVVLLHGCGNETNNVPVQNQSGQDAIVIRGVAQSDCWNTQQNGPDIPFFDAMVEATQNNFCADTTRTFAAGYSSGSHLINALACYRGDVLRGAGTVSGGSPMRNNCTGPVARVFIFDIDDMEAGNSIEQTADERDRLLELNGCDTNLEPEVFDPAPDLAQPPRTCTRYQGCGDNPIIWCETEGQMHGRQDQFASRAYWGMFSEL